MNRSMNNQVTVHTMDYYTGKPLIQIRACINIRCSAVWKTVKNEMPIVWFYLSKFKRKAQMNDDDVSQITHWLKHEKYCLGMGIQECSGALKVLHTLIWMVNIVVYTTINSLNPMLLYIIQWLNADLNTKAFLKLVESSKDRQSHTIYLNEE